jgi:hypothetical protein
MRAADVVVGRAKWRSPSDEHFPFRWLVLPLRRQRQLLGCLTFC